MLSILHNLDPELRNFLEIFAHTNTLTLREISKYRNKKKSITLLSILIQLRYVRYFCKKTTFYYQINREMVVRRLFYPIYLEYIRYNLDQETLNTFKTLIQVGILDIESFTTNPIFRYEKKSDIVTIDTPGAKKSVDLRADGDAKKFKNKRYLIIDYKYLDSLVFKEYCYSFLRNRYSPSMDEYFRRLEKSEIDASEEENNNFKYLLNDNFVTKGMFYRINYSELYSSIVRVKISSVLENRRIFNILYKSKIDDLETIKNILYPKNVIKNKMISLMKNGLINMSMISKNNIVWEVDIEKVTNLLRAIILRKISTLLGSMEEFEVKRNEEKLFEILGLTEYLFIFCYERDF